MTSFPKQLLGGVVLILATVASGFSQTVSLLALTKTGHNEQLSSSTSSFDGAELQAIILGSSGVTSASIVVGSLGGSTQAGQTKALTQSGGEWKFSSGTYPGGPSALFGDYGGGGYSVTVNGTTDSTNFGFPSGTFSGPNLPFATTSSGTISGGVLQYDASQALTINSGTFITGYTSGSAFISITVKGNGLDLHQISIAGFNTSGANFDVNTLSMTVPAFSFTSGLTYDVTVGYYSLVNSSSMVASPVSMLGGVGLTAYGKDSHFTVQAIPEPSTDATFAGMAALAVMIVRRRRRA